VKLIGISNLRTAFRCTLIAVRCISPLTSSGEPPFAPTRRIWFWIWSQIKKIGKRLFALFLARKRQHHFPTKSASLPRMLLRASLPAGGSITSATDLAHKSRWTLWYAFLR